MFIPHLVYKYRRRTRQDSWSTAFDIDYDIDFDYDVEPRHRINGEASSSFFPMEDEHADDCYSLSTGIDSQNTPGKDTSNASAVTTAISSVQSSHNIRSGGGHEPAPAPAASLEDVKLPAPTMDFGGSQMTSKTPPRSPSATSSVSSGANDSPKGHDQKLPPSTTSSSHVSAGKDEKSSSSSSMPLPNNFVPNDYSVIVGRGKKIRQSAGNLHLRTLCSTYLSQYSDAMNNKPVKTEIVNSIISIIRAVCPNGGSGAFIRMENGVWCAVSDRVAREKVGYVFRDLLHDRYESSAQSKAAKKNGRRSSTSSARSRSSIHSRSSSASSLVQHDQQCDTSTGSTTAKSSQKEDHTSSLSRFEPATVASSQALLGLGSGYASSFSSSMIQPRPLPMMMQQQQQQQQQQLQYNQMMMSSMPFQMMPNVQHQQPQYPGSSMMGSFPQQIQQQNFNPFHQNQATGQNWNPQLSDGAGWGSSHQDQQQQQQQHSSSSDENQQHRHHHDLAAHGANMMIMEPSPIMSGAAHIDHPRTTMQRQHGGSIEPADRRTTDTLSADDIAMILRNSELGRGMEDDS